MASGPSVSRGQIMKRLLIILSAVVLALMLTAGVATAHGGGRTADDIVGTDADHDIQFFAGSTLWTHVGFQDGIQRWNSYPGPKFVRVANKDRAEVIVSWGNPCYSPTVDGAWFGGVTLSHGAGNPYTMCLTRQSADGHTWGYVEFKHLVEHEFGHTLGDLHHTCADIQNGMTAETVMNVCQPLKYGVTQHDILYKSSI
jgi:hypothetical protein